MSPAVGVPCPECGSTRTSLIDEANEDPTDWVCAVCGHTFDPKEEEA